MRQQNDENSGQVGLFNKDELQSDYFEVPNIPEKGEREYLAWEKETMGFYVTGHPLDEYSDRIRDLTSITNIRSRTFNQGKMVKFAGIILDVRKHTTKKGDLMCFLRLEDYLDKIDVTVFTAQYYKSMQCLYPDNAVVIQGKVEYSGEDVVIIADSIWNAKSYEPDYYLTVSDNLEQEETYSKLKEIMQSHRGRNVVYLNKRGEWQKLNANYQVKYSEQLSSEFISLLGSENVRKY